MFQWIVIRILIGGPFIRREIEVFHVVEYTHPLLAFAITSPREAFMGDTICRRKPGALHHLAFKAESQAEVDRLYSELKGIGAVIVSKLP